jgi:hypothetical protein
VARQWSEHADPFAHLGPAQAMRASTRGPGWQRASRGGRFNPDPQRVIEARASAVSLGNKGRDDLALGQRVFHGKFGYGTIARHRRQQARNRLRARRPQGPRCGEMANVGDGTYSSKAKPYGYWSVQPELRVFC